MNINELNNTSTKDILDLVAYGLKAVKDLKARGLVELAETTEANVCLMMDVLYLRRNN